MCCGTCCDFAKLCVDDDDDVGVVELDRSVETGRLSDTETTLGGVVLYQGRGTLEGLTVLGGWRKRCHIGTARSAQHKRVREREGSEEHARHAACAARVAALLLLLQWTKVVCRGRQDDGGGATEEESWWTATENLEKLEGFGKGLGRPIHRVRRSEDDD
ncbi:hypothetical protein DFH06DRAFT_1143762 [Mycena polygramma]|nr:hypothetical protein DFH06DRAFT_1143762 [Mycena polygramma]